MMQIGTISPGMRSALLYGAGLAVSLFLLKWLELRFLIFDHAFEIYIGGIAVMFTALGIWLAKKLSKPRLHTVIVEKEIYRSASDKFVLDDAAFKRLGISRREHDILCLMAEGRSNADIASQLFVSLSTVKTHVQNIFQKLEVNRRMQAVEKARTLKLIA